MKPKKSIVPLALLLSIALPVLPAPADVIAVTVDGGAISAPDTLDTNDRLDVRIVDGASGTIELWGPIEGVAGSAPEARLVSALVQDGRATLDMRVRSGSYELRHVAQDGTVRARGLIDVSAPPVVVGLAETVEAGGEAQVRWCGPADPGDKLQLFDLAAKSVAAEVDALGELGCMMLTPMTMPKAEGTYLLRYVTGDGLVLRSVEVELASGKDWLRTPLGVATGQSFEVSWHGAERPGHLFRIVTAGGTTLSEVAASKGAGTLTAPSAAGNYYVEYADPATDTVAHRVPLDVDN